MRKVWISSLLLILVNCASAQYKPTLVDKFVIKLQKKGIDTILIYMAGSTWLIKKPNLNCNCPNTGVINTIYFLYKKNGKLYKINLSYCNESDTARIYKSESIPYFLSLKETFKNERDFYKNLRKNKQFPPPIPTDIPFESAELITRKEHLAFSLSSYQKHEGYKIWKEYFWIDKDIKLMALIKKDIMINPD